LRKNNGRLGRQNVLAAKLGVPQGGIVSRIRRSMSMSIGVLNSSPQAPFTNSSRVFAILSS
jgi:hypothetical protein